MRIVGTQTVPGVPVSFCPPPLDLPLEVRRDMMIFRSAASMVVVTNCDPVFDHFVAGSLNNLVWTNLVAHTNGRTMEIWSERTRPLGWPLRAAKVRWNTNSLLWGMRGLTAICPCWQGEGPPGWTPITALTRRHGYTRGHSMGDERFGNAYAGQKAWFLTRQNAIVEVKILREVVRTRQASGRDYTIVLFNSDLPPSIEPMRVMPCEADFWPINSRYVVCPGAPYPVFKTEQQGFVSADVPGFSVNTLVGGDSGSPNILPMPGELVFWNGRTTSGASPEMQADMDKLCRLDGLDPKKYQLQWVDLSKYPRY